MRSGAGRRDPAGLEGGGPGPPGGLGCCGVEAASWASTGVLTASRLPPRAEPPAGEPASSSSLVPAAGTRIFRIRLPRRVVTFNQTRPNQNDLDRAVCVIAGSARLAAGPWGGSVRVGSHTALSWVARPVSEHSPGVPVGYLCFHVGMV